MRICERALEAMALLPVYSFKEGEEEAEACEDEDSDHCPFCLAPIAEAASRSDTHTHTRTHTHRHTHRHTDRQTDRHTHVCVDLPKLAGQRL